MTGSRKRWMREACVAGLAMVGAVTMSAAPQAFAQPPPGAAGEAPGAGPGAGFPGGGRFGGPGGPGRRPAPADARAAAPIDLTGYWVSLITEDWRFRMVIPAKGDYNGVPLNAAAKKLADQWNPAPDEAAGKQCEAYGAGAVMLVPERLHIVWQDANTLVVYTDAGMQMRVLHFRPQAGGAGGAGARPDADGAGAKPDADAASTAPSWQGYSTARWDLHNSGAGFGGGGGGLIDVEQPKPPPPRGSLEIHTSDLLPGLIRKNGVPYSGKAQLTEYWEVNQDDEDRLLTVTSQLTDPQYLEAAYVTNALFQKQADDSGWAPTPCTLQR